VRTIPLLPPPRTLGAYAVSFLAIASPIRLAPPPSIKLLPPVPEGPYPLMSSTQPAWTTVSGASTIPMDKTLDTWRIALLGDGGVGKTALAMQVSLLLTLSDLF
jgi:hypothetical protein